MKEIGWYLNLSFSALVLDRVAAGGKETTNENKLKQQQQKKQANKQKHKNRTPLSSRP